jgi:hypothetical protein
MNRLFWSLIIFDAVMVFGLAIVLILLPGKGGPNVLDSFVGRVAAGLSILLVAVALAYWNTQSPGIHLSLLIVAAAPLVVGASYGVIFLRGRANERLVAKYNDDRLLIFNRDPMLTRFVAAIYEQDSSKVRALSQQVDINAVSASRDYTPLKLAVERAVEAEDKPEAADRALEMVRLLLSLGAKPNSGLHAACSHSSRTDAVRMLLDAGADPNNLGLSGTGPPAFYGCFSSRSEAAGLENLRLLRDHGADFTLKGDWMPTIPLAASSRRWETVLYLHQSGVPLRDDRDGGWIESRVEEDLADAKQNKREPTEALKRVAELLQE